MDAHGERLADADSAGRRGRGLCALASGVTARAEAIVQMRRGPSGLYGFRRQPVANDAEHATSTLTLETYVVPVFERSLYQPLTRAVLWVSALARRFQSGQLSVYLLYVPIATRRPARLTSASPTPRQQRVALLEHRGGAPYPG